MLVLISLAAHMILDSLLSATRSGVVKVYSANRNPFGGYITDDKSRREIFIHKSAIDEAGMDKLEKGQRVSFDVVEDGFGGFKAVNVKPTG